MPPDDKCPLGVENREKIKALDARVTKNEHNEEAILEKIDRINENLLGRPSWAVTTIITFLTSACVGLVVAMAKSAL